MRRLDDLRMAAPHLETQLARRKMPETLAEILAKHQALWRVRAMIGDIRAFVPQGAQANAAKPPLAGLDLRIEDIRHPIAGFQVGRADDTRRDVVVSVALRISLFGDADDKIGFADAAEVFRTVLPKLRTAFDEHGRNDVMAAGQILDELVQHVAWLNRALSVAPEMMMGITYRQVRLQALLPAPVPANRDFAIV